MFGEILGGAIGDIGGAIIGAFNSEQQRDFEREEANKAAARKREAATLAKQAANMGYDELMDTLGQYEGQRISTYDPNQLQAYKDIVNDYRPGIYDFKQFEYGKTVDDFMNPEAEKIAELAGLKTQASLAGQGAAKGTGALANMGYSRWEAANQLYRDAQNAMTADRQQAYKEYGDYIDRQQANLDRLSRGTLERANLLGGSITSEQQAQSDYWNSLMNLMGDKTQANINANLAMA